MINVREGNQDKRKAITLLVDSVEGMPTLVCHCKPVGQVWLGEVADAEIRVVVSSPQLVSDARTDQCAAAEPRELIKHFVRVVL